ncbi:MAG TPA: hypothetical protein VGH77_23765, partial [Streptosporangiaceae bacterium]
IAPFLALVVTLVYYRLTAAHSTSAAEPAWPPPPGSGVPPAGPGAGQTGTGTAQWPTPEPGPPPASPPSSGPDTQA